jgi:flagellar basal body P-ring formation protein FlgA
MSEVTDSRRQPRCACVLAAALSLFGATRWSAAEDLRADVQPLATIRAAAEALVSAQLEHTAGVTHVSAAALDPRLRLAHCARPLHAQLVNGMALQARATVGVGCESPRWAIYVPVIVERRIAVLVLRHAVEREALLSGADVSVETRTITGLDAAFLSDPAELRGRFVRRTLAAGTTLTVDMLTPNFLVRRGQQVLLVAGADGIEVRASGRALEDAPAGAHLKVQNLGSMKVVEGVVVGPAQVRVAQ